MTILTRNDLLRPAVILAADHILTPEDLDWDMVSEAYLAAMRVLPRVTRIADGQRDDGRSLIPGEILVSGSGGSWGSRWHAPLPLGTGSPEVNRLIFVSAMIISTHVGRGGDADIEEITEATKMAREVLTSIGFPLDAQTLGAIDPTRADLVELLPADVLPDLEAADFQLRRNGDTVLSGDGMSMAVVFNNLTGANFTHNSEEQWAGYRAYMSKTYTGTPDAFALGTEIALVTPENDVLAKGRIGDPVPELSYQDMHTKAPGAPAP